MFFPLSTASPEHVCEVWTQGHHGVYHRRASRAPGQVVPQRGAHLAQPILPDLQPERRRIARHRRSLPRRRRKVHMRGHQPRRHKHIIRISQGRR